jgi:benzoyl-CoA reductase/2-hydroxyglutaryl-CoA dehydratase subunit BcrC/BadD/HgdB
MPDFIPEGEIQVEIFELHGDLHDLKDPVDETEEIEISDEDIEDAFTRIERNELKSELIAVEEENHAPESELNEKGTESTLEENESNNNQIEQTNEDDFEWF